MHHIIAAFACQRSLASMLPNGNGSSYARQACKRMGKPTVCWTVAYAFNTRFFAVSAKNLCTLVRTLVRENSSRSTSDYAFSKNCKQTVKPLVTSCVLLIC